jgi:hypothetical protein
MIILPPMFLRPHHSLIHTILHTRMDIHIWCSSIWFIWCSSSIPSTLWSLVPSNAPPPRGARPPFRPIVTIIVPPSIESNIVGVWHRWCTTGRTAHCFWEDDDVDHSSMVVHAGHDGTQQFIQVRVAIRRSTLHPVGFWRLYCSEFEGLHVTPRGGRWRYLCDLAGSNHFVGVPHPCISSWVDIPTQIRALTRVYPLPATIVLSLPALSWPFSTTFVPICMRGPSFAAFSWSPRIDVWELKSASVSFCWGPRCIPWMTYREPFRRPMTWVHVLMTWEISIPHKYYFEPVSLHWRSTIPPTNGLDKDGGRRRIKWR